MLRKIGINGGGFLLPYVPQGTKRITCECISQSDNFILVLIEVSKHDEHCTMYLTYRKTCSPIQCSIIHPYPQKATKLGVEVIKNVC